MLFVLFAIIFSIVLGGCLCVLAWEPIQDFAAFIERKWVRRRLGFGRTGTQIKIRPWKPAQPAKPFWHPDRGFIGGLAVGAIAFLLYFLIHYILH